LPPGFLLGLQAQALGPGSEEGSFSWALTLLRYGRRLLNLKALPILAKLDAS
jgi:hypothetical protein